MNKKGQITIFIIVTIILIASVGLYFAFRDTLRENIINPKSEPIYLFVEECIKDTGEDAIYTIGQNGGYFFPIEFSTAEGIPYYYSNNRSYMPSKERIENEISLYIDEMLVFCINDFVNFPEFNITQGEMTTKTTIRDREVIFNVDFPLSITKGESTTRLKDFEDIRIPIRLGIIYNSIEEIIQEQLTREDICLSCLVKIGAENDLKINMINTEEATIFIIRDENYDIPLEFKFANKYS